MTCGVRENEPPVCWGCIDQSGLEDVPTGDFVQVSATGGAACVLDPAGAITCWGTNPPVLPGERYTVFEASDPGVCALEPDQQVVCSQIQSEPFDVLVGDYVDLAFYASMLCGLDSSGYVECASYDAPLTLHTDVMPPDARYASIDAFGDAMCGIRIDGTLDCVGTTPVDGTAPPTGTFVDVAVGGSLRCAIRTSGSVVCWGQNDVGQLDVPEDLR